MYLLNPNEKPCIIEVSLRGDCEARIVAIDAQVPRTVFIDRNKTVRGEAILHIPLPIAPAQLALDVQHEGVCKVRTKLLPLHLSPLELDKDLWAFLDFIGNISRFASELPEAKITDTEGVCFAYFADRLYKHDTGEETFSPARVSKNTGDMEINRAMFQDFTVPMRFFILLHERAHYELYSSNENECDKWALDLYLKLGFSPMEAVYAMTKVFNENARNVSRVKSILQKLGIKVK